MTSYAHDVERDFDTLIELMAQMIQAQAGLSIQPGDEWINDAQVLATKLFKQLCSSRMLLSTTEFLTHDGQHLAFVDHSSVTILTRSCIESYIVLHWIFQNEDQSLRKFRHGVWKLAGLMDRLDLHPTSEEARVKIADTRMQAGQLLSEVEASPHLQQYTPKQAKKLLKGDWRVDWSWTDEAVRAGFSKKYFENVYGHFCGYAHSSYISSMQICQAQEISQQYALGKASLQAGVNVMARFIKFYSELFPTAKSAFDSAPEAVRSVARYWSFGADEMDHLYEQEKGADPVGKGASGVASAAD
ncbi:DUF5677 domain-containing protein [Pseudomonas aeruginosa]|uniref:DUF5677 domain-containing protein n=1 Tax=Pseudomonas aeruginosa TaxID=287 RepID=UPI0022EBBE5A|nr:DUF5677 domain-containing protein [Pseudomonas aeruginosa]